MNTLTRMRRSNRSALYSYSRWTTFGFAVLCAATAARASDFTSGNVVLVRIGDGSAALTSAATAAFLDEFTPGGALVQSIAMPIAPSGANSSFATSGTATSEGGLTLSADGRYFLLTGYDAPLGTASVASSATPAVLRVIARVGLDTSIDTSTTTTNFSANNIRSAASTNGTDIWFAGANSGVIYNTLGGSGLGTQVSNTFTNLRVIDVFDGQLYVSSASSTLRLGTVGIGTPTSTGNTITNLAGFPTSGTSPYGYFFADLDAGVAGVDTLYVADDGAAAVQKWSLVGGTWTLNGAFGVDADDYRGVSGSVNGSTVTLFLTRKGGSGGAGGGELVTLADTAGYNANFSNTSPTLLATAASQTSFRGVQVVPPPKTHTYCTAKTTSNGCVPAIGSSGAPSATAGSGFDVNATQMINNKSCLLFYGVTGQNSTPFQAGILCVKAPIKRTVGTSTGGNPPPNDCSGVPSLDMNLFAVGGLGGSPHPALVVAGTVVDCQWWGRDPGFASPNNTQLSDGLEYTVGP